MKITNIIETEKKITARMNISTITIIIKSIKTQ